MKQHLISLGSSMARLTVNENGSAYVYPRLEIFQPESGDDGVFYAAQRVVINGVNDISALTELLELVKESKDA